MARIDAAYNYFLTTYGENIGNRYESHKKSELRDTYNKILKANKESPLYKISQSEDVGQFAIDVKEHANAMSLSVSNLSTSGDDIASVLDKRVATSSDSSTVDVMYVGDNSEDVSDFSIEVESLATPQVNTGNFLDPAGHDFEEGQYSFDLDTRAHSYEFQFNVNRGENNLAVQNKIVRLINTSDVGLSSGLISDKNGNNAVQITSKATGLSADEDYLFNIQSSISFRELNTLGISHVSSEATNSSFKLNGARHSSLSNTFTVNKAYEVSLKKASDSPVTIGLMNDTEALSVGINNLLGSYNGMIDIGLKYTGAHQNRTLYNDISAIAKSSSADLAAIGIESDGIGHLSLDKDKLSSAINSDDRQKAFDTLNSLKGSIKRAANKASINPMSYVDKVIVEYKNPHNTTSYPYAASAYSGMLVDYGL